MHVRGSGSGQEHRRTDNSFYRGVVVKNNDPLRLHRVKVYIPELTNQPFDEWFDEFDSLNIKMVGSNNSTDNFSDTKIFDEIAKHIPWAEQCFPLFGEGGISRYYKDGEICSISDTNYVSGLSSNTTSPTTLLSGTYSPSYIYENENTSLGDFFNSPLDTLSVNCNPYSFCYRSDKNTNKGKGLFGIPNVGTKVWVFHWDGDLNYPVYFGASKDYRELSLIDNTDNPSKLSNTYPGDFEN
jgi:hypothetical protein